MLDELNPLNQAAAFYAYGGYLDHAAPGAGREWIGRTCRAIDADGVDATLAGLAVAEGCRMVCDPFHATSYRALYGIQRAAIRYVGAFLNDGEAQADCQDLSVDADN